MKIPPIWSLFQNKNDCIFIGGENIADLLTIIRTQKGDIFHFSEEIIAPLASELEKWVKAHPHSRKKIQSPIILGALKKLDPNQEYTGLENYFIRPLKEPEALDVILHNESDQALVKSILSNYNIGTLEDLLENGPIYYEEETGDVFTADSYKELDNKSSNDEELYYRNDNGDILPFNIKKNSSELTVIQPNQHEFGIYLVKSCLTDDDSITTDNLDAIKEYLDDEMPDTLKPFTEEEKLALIKEVEAQITNNEWELPPRNLDLDYEDNSDEWTEEEEDEDKEEEDNKTSTSKNIDDDYWEDEKWDKEEISDDEDDKYK